MDIKNKAYELYRRFSNKIKLQIDPKQCEIILSLKEIVDDRYFLLDGRFFSKTDDDLYIQTLYEILGDSFSSISTKQFDRTTHFAIPDARGLYLSCSDDDNFKAKINQESIQQFSIESKDFFASIIANGYERRKTTILDKKYIDNFEPYDDSNKDKRMISSNDIVKKIEYDNDEVEDRKSIKINDKSYYFYIKVLMINGGGGLWLNPINNKLYNDTELNVGYALFEDKLYKDAELNIGYALFEDKLYKDTILNTGYIVFEDKLYKDSNLNVGFHLYNARASRLVYDESSLPESKISEWGEHHINVLYYNHITVRSQNLSFNTTHFTFGGVNRLTELYSYLSRYGFVIFHKGDWNSIASSNTSMSLLITDYPYGGSLKVYDHNNNGYLVHFGKSTSITGYITSLVRSDESSAIVVVCNIG